MRIERLKLLGFKSFVDPTELVIEPGLTGVVGPNGCGKSNLLEALRWAMGETSHKSMRAAAMDDVIFSGTQSRPARNMAEVGMVLDNRERQAPAEFNDHDVIEITRRIEREMGSNYRVNGRDVRARDIKLLFEDAATGARSPALVRQGQIGDIVNAKPEARRRILEDAAGTAGLYTRRHEAELRLNAAEANLERLDDVIGGLNTQIETLKRQARQARRYKEISAEIRRTEALFLFVCWSQAAMAAETAQERLAAMMVRHGEAVTAESQALKVEAAAASNVEPLREDEAVRAAVLARKRLELEHFDREVERRSAAARELAERVSQTRSDLGREQNVLSETAQIMTRLTTGLKALEDAAADDPTTLEALAATENDAREANQRTEAALSEKTADLAARKARKSELEVNLARHDKALEAVTARRAKLDREARELSANAPDTEALTDLRNRMAEAEATITAHEQALHDLEAESNEAAGRLTDARSKHQDQRLAHAELKTEATLLHKLLVADRGDGAEPVLDAITVEPGFEAALAAALGDDLDAPADQTAAIHWSRLQPAEGKTDHPAQPSAPLPEGATSLQDHVDVPPELALRFAHVGLVARADGDRLQTHLRPGQRLVSREGDLWRWDGFVARHDGESPAARRLAQRNRLDALETQLDRAQQALETARAAEDSATRAQERINTRRKQLQDELRQARETFDKHRHETDRLAEQQRAHEEQTARLKAARERCEEEAQLAARSKADLAGRLAEVDQSAISMAEGELAHARAAAEDTRATLATATAARLAAERETAARTRQIAAARQEIETWDNRSKSAAAQISDLERRLEALKQQAQATTTDPQAYAAERSKLVDVCEKAQTEHQQASDAFAAAQSALKAAQNALRTAQAQLADMREARARAEAENDAAIRARDTETQRIFDAFSLTPEACLDIAERPGDAELPDRDDLDRRLAKLKADRERLGGVNLAADDDLERIASEVDRIHTERADVADGIAKLRSAIQTLNKEGKKRLIQAFETVDGHFQELFTILFGGGEARLQLIENTEDPLQGGLEIIARPPGKKPATLSLLSGGEQTLTALSLIFAVFLTNPSPICVLDEVDAPLDDANVDRFCTMMEKMAKDTETRFLVITHHPMTMTRMNRLFGVTMAEKGVSQLVSVDLETAQGFREAS